ncbi:uncharacterized protein LOC115445501 [Manduca sexta]|uniref:Uncharacterized protein n=1 Tax=Manduca sexta TaxID=7130 RepID=A0A921Z890_MANSE|nr:uncharacterized protein LOC115445501 [Manduca sexta]KAG6453222.1 hypothetical protein O3G_MSEX008039 [Manduca sexta]
MHSSVVIFMVILSHALSSPIPYFDSDPLSPLTVVSDLNSRLVSHSKRLQGQDARLPLPTPQDLEAIKKVAQILVTLGQQVIPAIIGEPQTSTPTMVIDASNDPVNEKTALNNIMTTI